MKNILKISILSLVFINSLALGSDKKEDKMTSKAYLAGGCFWGMEKYLKTLDGVLDTNVGYIGGDQSKTTYNDVKTGQTGHAEAVEVLYDNSKLKYRDLIKFFFRIHDPTTLNRQKNDIGTQYRSAIFTNDTDEKNTINDLIEKINQSKYFDSEVVTKTENFEKFILAEDYHQDYLVKNPNGYNCHLINPKQFSFE